ncbi:MAG: TonB-dependent receptor [Bacteroidia bacterium]
MKRILFVLSLVASLGVQHVIAQTGVIKGFVTDKETGAPLMGAMIKCITSPTGAYTGINGDFMFSVPAGTHSIIVSYIGVKQNATNLVVKPNDTLVLHLSFGPEAQNAISGSLKVTAARSVKTATAIHMKQKKAVNMLDGISSQSFKRAGASTAGQAVARVSGVSVQGGKHVFVRGLGDRYSKTILNGMIIPGLDPDKNTVQMDVFPASLLDNILVYKSFSPDLPADFAGGLVNMNTKAFPPKKNQSISFSVGYNPAMHLQESFITYDGGGLDWLGMDDGTRALPISSTLDLTRPEFDPTSNNPELTELTSKFSGTLAPVQRKNTPDLGFSYTIGDQVNSEHASWGYHFTLNYKKESEFYQNAEFGYYIKPASEDDNDLLLDVDAKGPLASENVRWSSLIGTSFKNDHTSIQLSLLHSQNGESRSAQLTQIDYRENPSTIIKNNLEYTQRSVSNILLAANHKLGGNGWELDWRISPTLSMIDEPDIRLTAFEVTDDLDPRFEINEGVGAVATRTYRNLIEQNYNAKIDVTKSFIFRNEDAKLKFGVLETYKLRDFEILNYQFRIQQENKFNFTGNADELLATEMIWTPNENSANDSGVYVSGNPEPANTYAASQNIFSAYIMNILPLSKQLKITYGARMEKAENRYTGSNQAETVIYDKTKLLDELNILPSMNMTYKLNSNMNFRASYGHTLARPSFKELSNAQIVDRISGRTFLGNDSLQQTNIVNYDVKWENFMPSGQMISFSAFYKTFENPIELVAYSASAPNNFQPQNVGNAQVLGLEIEIRKNIHFLTDSLKRVQTGVNLTLVESSVEMTQSEYEGRLIAARGGEVINNQRDMVGQSPYIINGFINYLWLKKGLDLSLTYNVQGPRLSIVGVSRNPDVYELPFHSLNFRASMPLDKKRKMKLSAGAKNILNSARHLVYKSYGSTDQTFSKFLPQRSFSLGFSYTID